MIDLNKKTVNLSKGGLVNLSKDFSGPNEIHIGLGWDPVTNKPSGGGFLSKLFGGGSGSSSSSGADIDLDGWAALYGANGEKLDLIYYGNKVYNQGTIRHHGDNLTGEGDGDDEVLTINLHSIPAEVKYVVIGITIYQGIARHQQFGDIENTFIRLVDKRNDHEICRYQGTDFDKSHRTFYAGMFTRDGNEWKFTALGVSNATDRIEAARNEAVGLLNCY